jgi:hypothetical protein
MASLDLMTCDLLWATILVLYMMCVIEIVFATEASGTEDHGGYADDIDDGIYLQ